MAKASGVAVVFDRQEADTSDVARRRFPFRPASSPQWVISSGSVTIEVKPFPSLELSAWIPP
ncbi:MAG: hypothetical protein JW940_18220 [Polyangiaceae bacterium]|nr:hypothetical protein [Polyangiaceae bacterium]